MARTPGYSSLTAFLPVMPVAMTAPVNLRGADIASRQH
jgi:hypothetical protein